MGLPEWNIRNACANATAAKASIYFDKNKISFDVILDMDSWMSVLTGSFESAWGFWNRRADCTVVQCCTHSSPREESAMRNDKPCLSATLGSFRMIVSKSLHFPLPAESALGALAYCCTDSTLWWKLCLLFEKIMQIDWPCRSHKLKRNISNECDATCKNTVRITPTNKF